MEREKTLLCLNKHGKWLNVYNTNFSTNSANKYIKTYESILELLNSVKNEGSKIETNGVGRGTIYVHDNITTKVLNLISHRHGTIAKVIQYNKNTNGLRYLLYGIEHETDYGVGQGLFTHNDLKEMYNDKCCPENVTAKYI